MKTKPKAKQQVTAGKPKARRIRLVAQPPRSSCHST